MSEEETRKTNKQSQEPIMCSNTSSSGGGGGDGCDYASHILRKPKRQRVPKRGPGVAELEKILREQENANSVVLDKDKIEGFSSCRISSSFSKSYHPQSSVVSTNLLTGSNVPNILDHNHFSPPVPPHMTMLYSNGGKSTVLRGGNGGGGGVHIGGSSMVLPEQGMWSSCCDSAGYPFSPNGSDHMHHFPVMLQKKPCHYSSPSTMVGMKRPRTFSVDNTTSDPPFQFQVSPHFPHLNMPDKSSSRDIHTAFNLKQMETVSRDHAKPGGHFLIFGSAATPPYPQTSQQEFSKHNSLPFQETSEKANQVSSGQGGTVQKKPFFSFLIPEEQIGEAETALTLNNERGRTRGEAIDLNLKL
ncbi:hypothetical protein JRO89_XS06G0058300 [Xanthoceras sorbifolium]|uniref:SPOROCYTELESS-like EAR-containing protein 1 n=1 Tax=Xanthoceras sorbifolium TaxID=99658 RepID=A0ABQ8HX68_9ROSI|nr:hypothetical protein JRO89_XS06G0058300 [Xanthoceras sorbifolium]